MANSPDLLSLLAAVQSGNFMNGAGQQFSQLQNNVASRLFGDPNYVLTPDDYTTYYAKPYNGEDLRSLSSGLQQANKQSIAANEMQGSYGGFAPIAMFAAPMLASALGGGAGLGAEAGSTSGFGFGSPESLVGADAGGGGFGLGNIPTGGFPSGGGGGGDFTQLASDVGDQQDIDNLMQGATIQGTDSGSGGLGGFFGSISPDTWLRLGGTALGAGAGLFAQNRAINAQTQAANNAQALQAQMFQQNRADLAPWREAGVGALNQINAQMPEFTRRFGMADYQQDPGYQFRLSEGEKAINRAAQARGTFDSGATMKALDKYNSNMASQEFGNAYNRFTQDQTNAYNKLSNLAGLGQTSAQQIANLGGQYANNAGDLGLQAANARASSYIGGANTFANAINQGMTSYNQQQMLPYLRGYLGP